MKEQKYCITCKNWGPVPDASRFHKNQKNCQILWEDRPDKFKVLFGRKNKQSIVTASDFGCTEHEELDCDHIWNKTTPDFEVMCGNCGIKKSTLGIVDEALGRKKS